MFAVSVFEEVDNGVFDVAVVEDFDGLVAYVVDGKDGLVAKSVESVVIIGSVDNVFACEEGDGGFVVLEVAEVVEVVGSGADGEEQCCLSIACCAAEHHAELWAVAGEELGGALKSFGGAGGLGVLPLSVFYLGLVGGEEDVVGCLCLGGPPKT